MNRLKSMLTYPQTNEPREKKMQRPCRRSDAADVIVSGKILGKSTTCASRDSVGKASVTTTYMGNRQAQSVVGLATFNAQDSPRG